MHSPVIFIQFLRHKFKGLFLSSVLVTIFFLSFISLSNAQSFDDVKTSGKVMKDFMDKRFGMFIHFGPVTLRGTEIGWSRNKEVSAEDYDTLYKEFNPVLFNAETWIKTAKDAGMKYLTITAKHHDGFCLWPTRYSTYNVMYSPFKRDILGELAAACKKYGIAFCIYFSILDWHDPDYPVHNPYDSTQNVSGNMKRFVSTMKNELREIITKYDPYMLWFDGGWEKPWTNEMGKDMYKYLKSLKKDIIINNRLGKEITGVEDRQIDPAKMVGDFETPEQRVGELNMELPWESCITICNQWAWKPNDKMKSLKQCVQTLVGAAAGNGNLLLNVGPMSDGRIEARQVKLLHEMGNWLKIYGESIYETKGGPYIPNGTIASTRKENKIYLHILKKESTEIKLPAILKLKMTKAYFLKGTAVTFEQNENNIILELPEKLPNEDCSVVVLEFDDDTENIPLMKIDMG